MKISCQSCAAKYTIADEKVVGKVIKIKCKKCSSTIVVNGNDPAVLAQLGGPAADAASFDDGVATQLHNANPLAGAQAPNPDEWTVSVSDEDQRTHRTADLIAAYQRGELGPDPYVWKDGMGDWLPIAQVPELAAYLAQGAAPEAAAPVAAAAAFGGAVAAAAAAPEPEAPAPVAAARKGGRGGGGVDLFGGGGGAMAAAPAAAAAPAPAPPPFDKHVGERNETSVLFSLKDLVAAESAAAVAPAKKSGGGAFEAKNDRVDDILSLGSVSAAPMLAPPSFTAPVIEAPPPPPPPSAAFAPPPGMAMSAGPMSYGQPPPQKRSPLPIVGAAVGGALLVGVIGFFALGSGGDDKAKAEGTSKASTTETAKPATTTAAADTSKTSEPSSTGSDAPSGSDTAAPADTGKTAATSATDTGKTGTGAVAATTAKTADTAKKEEPKKEEPKKEEPKATGGSGDAPFDRGAASAALGSAAGSAKGCKKADGPTGSAKVQVTFAPSGRATQAVVGAPFAGTSVGSCIAGAFRGASVPPFSGSPVTVSKTVSIK